MERVSFDCEKGREANYAPVIEEAPVNIECVVTKIEKLGSHHMFLAEVKAVQVDESYMDEKGKFELNKTGLLAYSHGEYLGLGKKIGTFGYSVRKKKPLTNELLRRSQQKMNQGARNLQRKRTVNKNATFRKKGKAKK